jgi:hypothetical protein
LSSAPSPHSFIHVDDFSSPSELSAYLKHLDRNDAEYLSYFSWKWENPGIISQSQFIDMFCRICGLLFYADFNPSPNWSKKTVEWKDVNICLPQNVSHWPD